MIIIALVVSAISKSVIERWTYSNYHFSIILQGCEKFCKMKLKYITFSTLSNEYPSMS